MTQSPPLDADRPSDDISFGRELRRAREVRGFTIEQIAAETKINERYLHALENDRLDLLPGELYGRNFVRSVARMIGADEEDLLLYFNYQMRQHRAASGIPAAPAASSSRRRRPIVAVVGVAIALLILLLTLTMRDSTDDAVAGASTTQPSTSPVLPPGTESPPLSSPLPGASGATGGVVMEDPSSPQPAPVRPPPAVLATATPVPVALTPDPAATPAGTTSVPPDEAAIPRLRLAVTANTWIDVRRPGTDDEVGLYKKGDVIEYELDKPLTIEIANAAGVSLTVDGQPGKVLGGPQEKRILTIDRKNYRSFLK